VSTPYGEHDNFVYTRFLGSRGCSLPSLGLRRSRSHGVRSCLTSDEDKSNYFNDSLPQNKSVFSYLRTLKARHCPLLLMHAVLRPSAVSAQLCSNRSTSTGHRAHSNKPAARCCNRQADRRTDGHRTVSWTLFAHYAGSANTIIIKPTNKTEFGFQTHDNRRMRLIQSSRCGYMRHA